MNLKHIIVLTASAVVLAIIVALVWFFVSRPGQSAQTGGTSSPATFPLSENVPTATTTSSGAPGRIVSTVGGESVITDDFINNGTTIPDRSNTGRYLLAGNLGTCVTDPSRCQAASSTDFSISYDSASKSFNIVLLAEPIGQSRLNAEQFLGQALGITHQQMCLLHYYVGTPSWVNARYDSGNLGFSFCPGAVTLPQ